MSDPVNPLDLSSWYSELSDEDVGCSLLSALCWQSHANRWVDLVVVMNILTLTVYIMTLYTWYTSEQLYVSRGILSSHCISSLLLQSVWVHVVYILTTEYKYQNLMRQEYKVIYYMVLYSYYPLVILELYNHAVNRLCTLPASPGGGNEALPRYFFNSTSGRCEEFTYRGCGGNWNHFMTSDECNQHCNPNGESLLQLSVTSAS